MKALEERARFTSSQMSSFIDCITPDPKQAQTNQILKSQPFIRLPIFHGGFQVMYNFNFDSTDIKLDALRKLEKYLKYVPLRDLSPRLSGRLFFTIGCIINITKSTLTLSDLRGFKISVRYEEIPPLHQFDMVAVANCEVSITLGLRSSDQIMRIGHCEQVRKCSKCENNPEEKGILYVDPRNGPYCEYHCHQLVMESGQDRPLLKVAQSDLKFENSPFSSPVKAASAYHGPSIKLPDDYIEKYFQTHRGPRAARISKLFQPEKEVHQIGAGFSKGDIIVL